MRCHITWGLFKKLKVIKLFMNNFFKFISFYFLFTSSVAALSNEIKGSAWRGIQNDGDKIIFLFDKNGTFSYLNVISISGNQGRVFGDDSETWSVENNKLVISFNNGYAVCSLDRKKWTPESMQGTCINKKGKVEKIQLKLIK